MGQPHDPPTNTPQDARQDDPQDRRVEPWIQDAEASISQHRKRGVNIVVLDERGAVVPGARVSVRQQEHAFRIGCLLSGQGFAGLDVLGTDAPVWSVFNGVSLPNAASWRNLVNDAGWWDPQARRRLERFITRARSKRIGVRIGPWVNSDPAQNPDHLSQLPPADQLKQTLDDTLAMVRWLGDRVDAIELYGDREHRDGLVTEHGIGALRSLFEAARAGGTGAPLSVRYRDRLHGKAAVGFYESLLELRHGFVPFDRLSLDQTVDGLVYPSALQRDIQRLARYETPIDWVNLEVGGPSPAWAAQNLETVLRQAFAEPSIQSIWFGELTVDRCVNPHAALLDADGNPTEAGLVFTRLFKETWWDRIDATTSNQGLVQARLFYGLHTFEAQLPDGRVLTLTASITPPESNPLKAGPQDMGPPNARRLKSGAAEHGVPEAVERPRWVVLQAPASSRPGTGFTQAAQAPAP